MFVPIERLDRPDLPKVWTGEPLPRFAPPPSARAEHARFLGVAAARRLRAQERAGLNRREDADYWKAVAPAALQRARALLPSLARLPG